MSQSYATCYVADVYDGLDDVQRGEVKYLRISHHVGWPFDAQRGQMDYIPGNAGSRRIDFQSWSPVRVLGTAPVEADGSAHFQLPADQAVYFQALDENHMEVVRMRSLVGFKAGEVRGCRGCHESQGKAPAGSLRVPLAVLRPPSKLVPPPWGGDRLLGYEWLVQPILDQHCVHCHGEQDPDGGLDFTANRAADGLMQSYRTMFGQSREGQKPTHEAALYSMPIWIAVDEKVQGSGLWEPCGAGGFQTCHVGSARVGHGSQSRKSRMQLRVEVCEQMDASGPEVQGLFFMPVSV